jgi:hypothetical protein
MIASGAVKDLSRESWISAYDGMNEIHAKRYGFRQWKQIDWDALHAEFGPRMAAAENANDKDAYHLGIRHLSRLIYLIVPNGLGILITA